MKIQNVSGWRKQSSRDLKFVTLLFVAAFLMLLSTSSALGQGFKMTQLNPPGFQAGTAIPYGVNASEAVVGFGTATSGATVGFLYSGGKYTTLDFPKKNTFTRASGINDSNEIVGDWYEASANTYHGYTYVNGTYQQYDVGGKVSTSIFGVNSAGHFAGAEGHQGSTGFVKGFIYTGSGNPTEFFASGKDATYVYAINSSDEVVGEYLDSSNVAHGFYRSAAGKITAIEYPGATQTVAYGINDAGEITGTYINASNLPYGFTYIKGKYASTDFAATRGINSKGAYVGFYWGVDGVPSGYLASPQAFTLSTVKIPDEQEGFLYGVNKDDVSVGAYVDTSGQEHGMMVSDGKVTNIDDSNGVQTICFAINSANHIVGDYIDTNGNPHGFEYVAGKFTDISGPSGALSDDATGINDAGEISGDFYSGSDSTHHGFLFKGGKYTELDPPGSTNTFGAGINASGNATFFWVDSKGYVQSSLYNGKTFTSINVPGVASSYAQGINTAGDIVFVVYDPYGVGHSALKQGSSYFVFDDPKGFNAAAGGINDGGLIVGYYTPTGTTLAQPFKGTE
jgi:hypothetical protein